MPTCSVAGFLLCRTDRINLLRISMLPYQVDQSLHLIYPLVTKRAQKKRAGERGGGTSRLVRGKAVATSKPYAVFLSYNGDDRKAVERLAVHLADNAKLSPWFDRWTLIPGEPWARNLERGLVDSLSCAV